MMDIISRKTIENLISDTHKVAVSIFMACHPEGTEVKEDRIRFKNLITEAEQQLKNKGVHEETIDQMLKEPRSFLSSSRFWKDQSKGLAFFITEDEMRYYRLPRAFEERIYVNDHFLIIPLLPLLNREGSFHILAVSQNNISLYESTQQHIRQITLDDIPTSLEEHEQYTVAGKEHQYQSARVSGSSVIPGQAGDVDSQNRELMDFLQHVENGVTQYLRKQGKPTPLILAGVDRMTSMYKKVNKYDMLFDETISGNADHTKPEQLQEDGWKIAAPYYMRSQYNAVERYNDLSDTNRTSSDIEKIILAAKMGKVETLFIPAYEQNTVWGMLNNNELTDGDAIQFAEKEDPKAIDVYNHTAAEVIDKSGEVYSMDPDDMPGHTSVAAIYRYE